MSSVQQLKLQIVLATTIFFFGHQAAVSNKPIAQEWILVQQGADTGQYNMYLSLDALKVESKERGFYVAAKAPDWNVFFFRPAQKIFWACKLEDFMEPMMANPYMAPRTIPHVPIVVRGTFDPASQKPKMIVDITGTGVADGLKYTQISGLNNNCRFTMRTANDIKIAPKAAELLCRLHSLPQTDTVPIYARLSPKAPSTYAAQHQAEKRTLVGLDTEFRDLRSAPFEKLVTKSSKMVPLNSADFVFPLGYKRVLLLTDVTYSHGIKSEMAEMIEGVGFTTPEAKKAKLEPKPKPKLQP